MQNLSLRPSEDLKKIFSLSWPVMLSIILQNLLGTVDMIFIGKLGIEELAAAALSSSVSAVIFVTSSIVSSGTVALVSRSFGEGDTQSVKKYHSISIYLSLVIGGALSIICFLYTAPIVRFMFNPSKEVLNYSNQYLSLLFLGTFLVFLNSTLRTTIQSLGDTMSPLRIFFISNIINAILSPLLMFGFNLGIRGSALAAGIAMIFSSLSLNTLIVKRLYNNNHREFLSSLKFDLKDSLRVLKIGSWSCLQQVARPITGVLMYKLVFQVGKDAAVSAFGVGGNLFSYTFIILSGLSTGVAILVGQDLGRKDYDGCDKLIKEGNRLAFFNMLVFTIPYMLFPGHFIRIFSDNPEIISVGADYLRIVYVGVFFVIFPTIYGGVFQGAGDTFPPFISSFIANVILKLPLAYILAISLKLGANGVWASIALSVIIEAAIISIYFKQNKWKRKEV